MFERLKICWLVLTKKYYAVFFYNKRKEGESGAACYMDNQSERDDWFLNACMTYWRGVALKHGDIEILEKSIKFHKNSILYCNGEIENLLRIKLEKLLKKTPEHKLYGFGKDYFCLESGKIVYVDQWGNHIVIRNLLRALRNNTWTLYERICDVKLDNR